ncbi:MAG: hypothetical protein JNM81_17950 [Rhodospirillaceae bacterium]|nr:hypothetical protein [Rhodospirillaceae bacterium]
MFTPDQKELMAFLAESALELATQAHSTSGRELNALLNEAEELMAIRTRLMNRHWTTANSNQLELQFEMKKAA